LGKASEKPVSNRRERGGSGLPQIASFLTEAPWEVGQVNERRLMVMNQCSQTRIRRDLPSSWMIQVREKVAILQREWDGNTLEKSAKQIME
jgi:hypothetical protein